MIFVDPRDGAPKPGVPQHIADELLDSKKLVDYLHNLALPAQRERLNFGDVCFEGNGPNGKITIGIERKRIHDMLNCIDDARYNEQRIGMAQMYAKSFLLLEGMWAPHYDNLVLMENKGNGWFPSRHNSSGVMYNKLYRYLISVALSGVVITYTDCLRHTAINISEIYHYFQKKWDQHTSLRETRKLPIPTLEFTPTLTRMWAADIDGVGVKHSESAEKYFKKPIRLANSDELDWIKVGVHPATAQKIIKQIHQQDRI